MRPERPPDWIWRFTAKRPMLKAFDDQTGLWCGQQVTAKSTEAVLSIEPTRYPGGTIRRKEVGKCNLKATNSNAISRSSMAPLLCGQPSGPYSGARFRQSIQSSDPRLRLNHSSRGRRATVRRPRCRETNDLTAVVDRLI